MKETASHLSIFLESIKSRIKTSWKHGGIAKIYQNLAWLFIDKVIRIGLGMAVGIVLARYLKPENFGLLNYALSQVALIGTIASLGLDKVVVREIVKSNDHAEEYLSAAFILKLLGGAAAVTMLLIATSFLNSDDSLTRLLVAILSFSLLFKATEVVKYWFEAFVESRIVVWIENLIFTISSLIKILFVFQKMSLMSFALVILLESAFTAIGLIYIYYKKGHRLKWCSSLPQTAKSLLRTSWPLMFASLAVMVYMRIDMVMLQLMSGSHEVGIYAAATRISEAWYFIPMILTATLAPSIIQTHAQNRPDYLKKIQRLYFYLTWLAIIVSVPILLLSSPLIDLLYGEEYTESATVLAIHLWASVAVFLGVGSSQYLIIENLEKISLYRTTIGACANIVLNLALIPSLGAIGAAIATVISYYISVFSLIFFKKTRAHALLLAASPFKFKPYVS